MLIHKDCSFFKGDIPCKPHKEFGYHCEGCPSYKKISAKILIIKLGAIGDVIRTTPLVKKLRQEFPSAQINWLTYTPDILSKNWVDRILNVTPENIELLKQINFEGVLNLQSLIN